MSTVTIAHFDIFDYWKDKTINHRGEVCSLMARKAGFTPVIVDWAEPECWACGRRCVRPKQELAIQNECRGKDGSFNFKKLWNHEEIKRSFERCHIIPCSLGGSCEPSNMFLLCPECHALSPDTTNPSSFFRWVHRRRLETFQGATHPIILFDKLAEEMEARGVDFREVMSAVDDEVTHKGLYEYAEGKMGTHFHSIADSTLVAIAADYLISLWTKKTLKD